MNNIDLLAKKLWDYHHLNQVLESADIIFCFTSIDLSVPAYCAKLFKEKFAPRILISGGNATNLSIHDSQNIQKTDWGKDSEAEKYAEVAIENGVPEESIIMETKSSNSGENVLFSYEVLKNMNLLPKKVLLVHKPTMERRAFATFKNYWPDDSTELIVTSAPYTYDEYVGKIVEKDLIINIMVGDIQRIKLYPDMGFQIIQDIPTEVWSAYEELVKLGYDKHLIHKK